jgi:hypothetical protein
MSLHQDAQQDHNIHINNTLGEKKKKIYIYIYIFGYNINTELNQNLPFVLHGLIVLHIQYYYYCGLVF